MASLATFRRADYKQLEVWIKERIHAHLDSAYGCLSYHVDPLSSRYVKQDVKEDQCGGSGYTWEILYPSEPYFLREGLY